MGSHRSGPRLRVAAALAVVAVGAPDTVAVAGEAPGAPPRLVAAVGAVTVERVPGNGFLLNPGTHLVAGSSPIEVRVRRASYHDPVVAGLVVRSARATRTVRLPDRLVNGFAGFRAFTRVSVTDGSGAVVYERDEDFCPNTYGTGRTRPDAPATSPYPRTCPTRPFTLGSVWGIQAGWSAQTTSEMTGTEPLDLPDGVYTVTVTVNQPYRELLRIPDGPASASVTMFVRTAEEPTAAPRASAHGGHAHGVPTGPDPAARRPAGPAGAPAGPRPDLRPLPAWWIRAFSDWDGRDQLAFDATVWNAGTSPLVVDGFRRPGADLMDAYQYFFDARGNQTGYVPAGTMEWDARPGHDHWHFTDFARYRLLDEGGTTAVRSGKEAFCLVNTDAVDYTVPNAVWRPSGTDLGSSCGGPSAAAIRQVLDIGNGDTYTQDLPGQSFDITDLPNGTYHLEVAANPENRLRESDTTNNVAVRTVILGGGPGNRTATAAPFPGLEG